jgi:arylsulfatase A-like enzyme
MPAEPVRDSQSRWWVRGLRAVAAVALVVSGCHPATGPKAPPAPPIVLITLDALRADVVSGLGGDPGLTPHLAELVRDVDWAGTAVATSSDDVPSKASLLTGLQPWQHQAILPTQAVLPTDAQTLAEALRARGYQTWAYISSDDTSRENGYARGFDSFQELGRGWDAASTLSDLTGGRQFVWLEIPEPSAPYLRRTWLHPNLAGGGDREADLRQLPRSIEIPELDVYADPRHVLPEKDRRLFWTMYRLNVAWADERLSRLLEALRSSGQWQRALVVITSNHGEGFGEHGSVAHGKTLGREEIEVPLLIKLPAGWSRRLAVTSGTPVGAARLWATLIEAAGGSPAPAVAPSLFRPGPPEALSELYRGNGVNEFSLVSGRDQLLWNTRFAPADPAFSRARADLAEEDSDDPPAAALAVVNRMTQLFGSALPLHGLGARPQLRYEHWELHGTSAPSNPALARRLAQRLGELWQREAGEERTPDFELRRRMPVSH